MRLSKISFALVSAALLAGPAFAQTAAPKPAARPAPRPAATAQPAGSMDIRGFRSASFGMSQAQVRSAIAADFGAATKIEETANAQEGTQVLIVNLNQLDPGPGPAQVSYIFGATSKMLSNINVIWATPGEATEAQREAVVTAGAQLVGYFQSQPAPVKASQGPSPTGPNGLVLYAAIDKKNAGIEILVDGIAYQQNGDKPVPSPKPTGPASLRVAYVQDADRPDVKTIKPGSF